MIVLFSQFPDFGNERKMLAKPKTIYRCLINQLNIISKLMNQHKEICRTQLEELAQAMAPNKSDIQADLLEDWIADLIIENNQRFEIDIGHFQWSLGLGPEWQFVLPHEVVEVRAKEIIKQIEIWGKKHGIHISYMGIYLAGIPYSVMVG
jgi:hypothetical protein